MGDRAPPGGLGRRVALRGANWDAIRDRAPVVEHVMTGDAETFLWRRDDDPWERNVWNIHPEYEIHLVRNASGIAFVGDHIERFEPGHLTIVGSDLPHDCVTSLGMGERIAGRDILLVADLAKSAEPERAGREALAAWGTIDILVNDAGISIPNLLVTKPLPNET